MLPTWSTSCLDWERRIVARESLIAFPPLFQDQADEALDVFRELKVVDMGSGDDSPTMGELSRPWILEFVSSVFGAYDAEAGRRLIQEFFLLISKKNTKSTTAAGIMLTALVKNWRQSAEFLILAPTIEIANNSFKPARDMVKHDSELSVLLHVQDNIRTITHLETGATLKVVAADSDTVGGKKATGVLVDELWLLGKQPNAENMLREATGGLASRPDGFVIYLTTQSDQPPAGVFKQKLQYARDVRDGLVVDPKFLPVLYEFPKAMLAAKQEREPKNFYVTNPNLGASVDVEYIERQHKIAKNDGEASMRGFLAKHLNVEIGLALRADRWAGALFWEPLGTEKKLTLSALLKRCEVVTAGIDGGGLDDLLALTVSGRELLTGRWLVWTHAWAHPTVLERHQSEAARFKDFSDDGDLTLVEKIGDDLVELAAYVAECEESGLLEMVGCDPSGLGGILAALAEAGVPEEKIIGITQGWKMTGVIKTTERKLAEGGLLHGGQPMMAWCVGNAKVVPAGNAVIITKQASGTAKIDPLLSTFNALTLLSLNPVSRVRSDDIFSNPIMVGI